MDFAFAAWRRQTEQDLDRLNFTIGVKAMAKESELSSDGEDEAEDSYTRDSMDFAFAAWRRQTEQDLDRLNFTIGIKEASVEHELSPSSWSSFRAAVRDAAPDWQATRDAGQKPPAEEHQEPALPKIDNVRSNLKDSDSRSRQSQGAMDLNAELQQSLEMAKSTEAAKARTPSGALGSRDPTRPAPQSQGSQPHFLMVPQDSDQEGSPNSGGQRSGRVPTSTVAGCGSHIFSKMVLLTRPAARHRRIHQPCT
jgi:hypothetical protein